MKDFFENNIIIMIATKEEPQDVLKEGLVIDINTVKAEIIKSQESYENFLRHNEQFANDLDKENIAVLNFSNDFMGKFFNKKDTSNYINNIKESRAAELLVLASVCKPIDIKGMEISTYYVNPIFVDSVYDINLNKNINHLNYENLKPHVQDKFVDMVKSGIDGFKDLQVDEGLTK